MALLNALEKKTLVKVVLGVKFKVWINVQVFKQVLSLAHLCIQWFIIEQYSFDSWKVHGWQREEIELQLYITAFLET